MGGLWILDLMTVIVSIIGILVVLFHFKKGRIGKKELAGGIFVFALLTIISLSAG